MTKFYRIVLSIIFPILFVSCSGDYEGVGDSSASKPQNEVKTIVISFPSGNFDINSDIVFKATSDANEDITSFCEFFVNDTKISGNTFKSASAGDFTVYCKYNSIKSNTATFKVVSASQLIMTITSTTSGVTDGSSTSDSSIDLKFTSNKSTSDFAVGDITISGGTLSSFSGSGTTYSATFTPAGAGDKTIDIAANTFTDGSGNQNEASTQFNWKYVANTPKNFKTNVIVEDFTGAWCGYCPRVAYKLHELKKTLTTQLVVVAAHYGDVLQYSKITEMTTAFSVSSYPHARVNRTSKWNEQNSMITSLTGTNAKVGVALESSISGSTLTVKFKAKFSEDFSDLKFGVFILEDDLLLDQRNYADFGYGSDDPLVNFKHEDVLRHALTSPLGDNIASSSTKKGATYEKEYTYVVPDKYGTFSVDKSKLKIVGFITDKDKKALNSRLSAIGSTQTFEEL